MAACLLESQTCCTLGAEIALPALARPAALPQPGDTLCRFHNAAGPVTRYAVPLAAAWRRGADRRKETLRSNLHCDRHDRLWRLSPTAIQEPDQARPRARNPQ